MREINIGLTGRPSTQNISRNGKGSDYVIEGRIDRAGWYMLGHYVSETNTGRATVVKRWCLANREKLTNFVNEHGPGELNVRAISKKAYNNGELVV